MKNAQVFGNGGAQEGREEEVVEFDVQKPILSETALPGSSFLPTCTCEPRRKLFARLGL